MRGNTQAALEAADRAYHEGVFRIAAGVFGDGDELAQFIHDEIKGVLSDSEGSLPDDLGKAAYALNVAREELASVAFALEAAAQRDGA